MSQFSRAAETILAVTFASTVYGALYFAPSLFFISEDSKFQTEVVPALPFWAIVATGCYLLARLGYGVLTFNDTKEAYVELMGDNPMGIEGAKRALKARGVGTD